MQLDNCLVTLGTIGKGDERRRRAGELDVLDGVVILAQQVAQVALGRARREAADTQR